jgi:hypothetical protein
MGLQRISRKALEQEPKPFHRKKSSESDTLDITVDSLYWPKDLLSEDFKNFGILTYRYDSGPFLYQG